MHQSRQPMGVPVGGQFATMQRPESDDLRLDAEGNWPVVTGETFDWKDSWRTYEAAVVPEIAGLDVSAALSAETLVEVGRAQQAISDFDRQMTDEFGEMELGTVDTVLLRSEATSSSQIEHLTVSAKQLALAELGETKSLNARMVQGSVTAMEGALAGGGGLDTEAVTQMQREILGETDLHIGVRAEQVWIGTKGDTPVGADFVAPHHTRVEANLDDLWAFSRADSNLPLAQAAVMHAQFETIHPFVDGNGRVGRALVHQYLRRSGLTSHVTVPVSAGLLADPTGYVDALVAYRNGDPEPIVAAFNRASINAAGIGREMIGELRAVRTSWDGRIDARRDSVAWKIADGLIGHPAVTTDTAARRYGVSVVAARTAIATLVEAGVLRRVSNGRRNQVWAAEEVTSCYDRISVLIGRRKSY